jgi:hypothetical protein
VFYVEAKNTKSSITLRLLTVAVFAKALSARGIKPMSLPPTENLDEVPLPNVLLDVLAIGDWGEMFASE